MQRWRLVLARDAAGAGVAQRDQQASWEQALVDSGLPLAGLDAPRPRPRFALAAPLGAGIAGEAELADLWLVERRPIWCVREAVAPNLPPGWQLRDLYDVWLGEPALPGQVVAAVYRATLPPVADPAALAAAAAGIRAAETLPRERQKGERLVAYDLRPLLLDVAVSPPAAESDVTTVWMTLRHDPERGVGRPDETLALLGDRAGLTLVPERMERVCLELADRAPREPAPRRRRPAQRSPSRPSPER